MCTHRWEEKKRSIYWDYWGNAVLKVEFVCVCCGKKKIRKYW